MNKIDCVITRYNEHIDWIEYINPMVDNFYIYNKGPNNDVFKNLIPDYSIQKKITNIHLDNIGRIDHTIAYHILENWESLSDITIFLPASILMCQRKGGYLNGIRRNIVKLKEKYNGFYSPRFHKVDIDYNYSIDDYRAEGACNRNNNKFIKSEYPDFVQWKSAIIDQRPIKYLAMRGMFAVCKENIQNVDKKIYERLLESLSVGDNIENGHFAERIWAHLFVVEKKEVEELKLKNGCIIS